MTEIIDQKNQSLVQQDSSHSNGRGDNDVQDPDSQNLSKLGIRRRKRRIPIASFAIVLLAWFCFAVAFVTIWDFPMYRSIPWSLGLTRQFQIIGVLLSLMYRCFQKIAPEFFLLLEANLGSYLQNYEAILSNSVFRPKTHIAWRATLLSFIVIPLGLSVFYKNFDHGVGHSGRLIADHPYGLAPPMGIDKADTGSVGLSIMANSTLPFTSATSEDPEFPSLPKAYGFNILLLSNTSSASLDCPVPDYLRELQGQMTVNEAYTLTADVRGIVTTYNESIEVYRNDDAFWNYYLNMTGDNEDEYISAKNQSDRDKLLVLRLDSKDMFNSHSLNLLMNDLLVLNTSWTFASFLNSSYRGGPAEVEASAFRSSAMLFQTRRESCRGTWRITYNSIRLVDGSCDGPRLPDQSQQMLTQAVLALRIWYMPMLCEYLGAFSDLRNASVWKVPTFTTVIASMYWSRLSKRRTQTKSNLEKWDEYDFYIVQDHLVSERRVMNTSPWLLVVLAFFPVLTTFAFAGCIILHKVPIDGQRFGIVALLAGVKHDTLKLLDGASLSGDLKRRVGVRFERKTGQQIEYSLTDGQATPSGQWKIFGGSRYSPVKSEY